MDVASVVCNEREIRAAGFATNKKDAERVVQVALAVALALTIAPWKVKDAFLVVLRDRMERVTELATLGY